MITAEVVTDFKDPEKVLKAIKPDMQNTERFEVELVPGKTNITLKVKAKDTGAMQAALNSYMRLLSMIKEVDNAENVRRTHGTTPPHPFGEAAGGRTNKGGKD